MKGNEIPLEARIVAVADVFDALISPRPYKQAWGIEEALGYMYAQRGRLFCPDCVDVLMRERERLQEICMQYPAKEAGNIRARLVANDSPDQS